MSPSSLKPLAQSESKARFMERLGLDEDNEQHRRIYQLMKEEAVHGRRRMTSNAEVLAPHVRNDPSIEPPYSIAQISETAIHREILRIYQFARPETISYYDLGRSNDGAAEENWIIRWMVWHVFRYRDNRNRNRGQAASTVPASPTSAGHLSSPQASYQAAKDDSPSHITAIDETDSHPTMWDPVRNTWVRRGMK